MYRIRDIREDNDLTQSDIAKLLKTTQENYHRYETQKIDLPTRHLITLSKFYNISCDYLLGLIDEPKKLYPTK